FRCPIAFTNRRQFPPIKCYSRFLSASPLFFSNHPATPEIYTLSLHDALPISTRRPDKGNNWSQPQPGSSIRMPRSPCPEESLWSDRKSTRLNSSHVEKSYAAFCLKNKIQKRCLR